MPPVETIGSSAGVIAIIVQAGCLGLLLFVIWAVVMRVLPENRAHTKGMQEAFTASAALMQAQFIAAIEKHEDDHRSEVGSILAAHERTVDKITAGDADRIQALTRIEEHMRAQTTILRGVIISTPTREARTRSTDVRG